MSTLLNACEYSFRDLVICAKNISNNDSFLDEYLKVLYSLKQPVRNIEVKKLCKEANWYFKDIVGTDGIVYTSFSPLQK